MLSLKSMSEMTEIEASFASKDKDSNPNASELITDVIKQQLSTGDFKTIINTLVNNPEICKTFSVIYVMRKPKYGLQILCTGLIEQIYYNMETTKNCDYYTSCIAILVGRLMTSNPELYRSISHGDKVILFTVFKLRDIKRSIEKYVQRRYLGKRYNGF